MEKLGNKYPVKRLGADSRYESEENYRYVARSEQLSLFVKPFNHEQKRNGNSRQILPQREYGL